MEVGEQPTLRLLDETLDTRRNPKPLELARHQLVARHHRLDVLHPVLFGQRTAAGFLRFESVWQTMNEILVSASRLWHAAAYFLGSSFSL